jgi:hypothetical protein
MIFAFIADAQRVGQQLAESANGRLEQSNIERAGNNLTIQWQGGTGPFQLQGIREITSSTWEDIGPPLMGSTVSLPIDAASAIYRVRDLRP